MKENLRFSLNWSICRFSPWNGLVQGLTQYLGWVLEKTAF
jgi:hypothetical protein